MKSKRQSIWRRMWPFIWPHRKIFLGSLLLAPLLSGLNLIQPYLLKVAIDAHILKGDLPGLTRIIWMFLAAFGLEYVMNFAQVYLLQLSGQRVVYGLREALFAKVQRLDRRFFDKTPLGVTLTRLTNDGEAVHELFASGLVSLAWDIFRLILTVVAMLLLNWRLTLVTFTVLPVLLGVVFFFRRLLDRGYRRVREKLVNLQVFIQEHVNGVRLIQYFRQQKRCSREFGQLNVEYRDENMATVRYDAYLYAGVEALSSIAVALILWYGGGELIRGAVSFGVLVAFIEYIERFFIPIRDVSAKFAVIQSARVALGKMFSLLDEEIRVASPAAPQSCPPSIDQLVVRHATFSYDEGKAVLQNIDFTVKQGEHVALVGMTGSGKSTLLKLLNRTYDVDSGSVDLGAVQARAVDLPSWRRLFSVVPQEVFLFSGTIAENMTLFDPRIPRERLVDAAKRVGAHSFIHRLPAGYDHPIRSRGANLSMGERQLIAMVRALLFDAPVLLLDEASAHVDPLTARLLQQALNELSRDRTVILAAHRLKSLQKMDRILVFHRGQIVESGDHRELIRKNGLYAQLCRLDAVTA